MLCTADYIQLGQQPNAQHISLGNLSLPWEDAPLIVWDVRDIATVER